MHTYSATQKYHHGDKVTHDGARYRATTDVPLGVFNRSYWSLIESEEPFTPPASSFFSEPFTPSPTPEISMPDFSTFDSSPSTPDPAPDFSAGGGDTSGGGGGGSW